MVGTALAIAGGALLSGAAGAVGSKSSSSTSSGVNLDAASTAETDAGNASNASYKQLQAMADAGPGQSDVAAAQSNNQSLASMLGDYAKSGGQPTSDDINTANHTAGNLFQGQQTALNQSFIDQTTNANRQAATMGRDMNDPVLAAKLATEQSRQQSQLSANQGSFAQQYAMQQPGMRLGYAQQQNSLLNGLSTQAMANRQAIASMGSSIQGNERNFRLSTAQHYGNSTQSSGGGIGGAITGALGGIGTGMSFAAGMNGSNPFTQSANVGGFAQSSPISMSGTGTSTGALTGMNYGVNNFGASPFSGRGY